jgi:hypothetical protein
MPPWPRVASSSFRLISMFSLVFLFSSSCSTSAAKEWARRECHGFFSPPLAARQQQKSGHNGNVM